MLDISCQIMYHIVMFDWILNHIFSLTLLPALIICIAIQQWEAWHETPHQKWIRQMREKGKWS